MRKGWAGAASGGCRWMVAVGAGLALAALPAVAGASAGSGRVKGGYYASLVGVRSADVEFHVRADGTAIPDLALVCFPADSSILAGTSDAQIAVKAPKLRIRGGRFSYSGAAVVTAASAGGAMLTTSTLNISAHHVDGPVHHYTFEGKHLEQTTAWLGTVSSPACASVPDSGRLTLFGPVPGE